MRKSTENKNISPKSTEKKLPEASENTEKNLIGFTHDPSAWLSFSEPYQRIIESLVVSISEWGALKSLQSAAWEGGKRWSWLTWGVFSVITYWPQWPLKNYGLRNPGTSGFSRYISIDSENSGVVVQNVLRSPWAPFQWNVMLHMPEHFVLTHIHTYIHSVCPFIQQMINGRSLHFASHL